MSHNDTQHSIKNILVDDSWLEANGSLNIGSRFCFVNKNWLEQWTDIPNNHDWNGGKCSVEMTWSLFRGLEITDKYYVVDHLAEDVIIGRSTLCRDVGWTSIYDSPRDFGIDPDEEFKDQPVLDKFGIEVRLDLSDRPIVVSRF